MNNPNSGTPQQPGNAPPQGITQEYVAQLVVAFMQLYACILALPGGYEALQAAQEIITSDAKRPANSIVLSVPANKGQTIGQNKRPPCKQRTRKAAKRERLTDHIPQPFYHTRQPISSPAPTQGTVNGYPSP